ncbi:MAG: hypothetical protein OXG51_07795 [Gammaproteobacteria bacterium]|nr:hypothetical protein [Gammaproteobacteria bacterium]
MLRPAVEEHVLEAGGGELPVDQVVEWLAEWGGEVRRPQRRMLLTGHRANGLEFDHGVFPDGA